MITAEPVQSEGRIREPVRNKMEEWELIQSVRKFYRRNVDFRGILIEDGTKFSEKAKSLTLFGSTVGGVTSMIVGLNYGGTIAATIPRAAYAGLWGAVLGGTYISTVHVCAKIRQADTPINHFLGGMATGFMVGAKARSMMWGSRAAFVLGAIGFLLKDAQNNGSLDDMPESMVAPRQARYFTPQGYRNVGKYNPEEAYTSPVSELVKIQEDNLK